MLSDRVRPDVEAAPWVVEEIKALEAENATLREENATLKVALYPRYTEADFRLLDEAEKILSEFDRVRQPTTDKEE